jgi:hypothetical protein
LVIDLPFVEVYTPIPAEEIRRSVWGAWAVGAVVVLVALGFGIAAAVRYTPQPENRNFGTVQTRFGTAGVLCLGGEPGCGQATVLEFPKCTAALRGYFSNSSHNDARARELLGKRPPTGNQWFPLCGSPQLIRGAPAQLESN